MEELTRCMPDLHIAQPMPPWPQFIKNQFLAAANWYKNDRVLLGHHPWDMQTPLPPSIDAACFWYYHMLASDTLYASEPFFSPHSTFKDKRSNTTYYLRDGMTEKNTNVIFLDECPICPVRYVGETSKSYRDRYATGPPGHMKTHLDEKHNGGDVQKPTILQEIREKDLFTVPKLQALFDDEDNLVDLRHIWALWTNKLTIAPPPASPIAPAMVPSQGDLNKQRQTSITDPDRKKMKKILDTMIDLETPATPMASFLSSAVI